MTQWDLCVATHVSQTALSRIENGHSRPVLNTLEAFSKALNVPLAFFYVHAMSHDGAKDERNEKNIMITSLLKRLLSELFEEDESRLLLQDLAQDDLKYVKVV